VEGFGNIGFKDDNIAANSVLRVKAALRKNGHLREVALFPYLDYLDLPEGKGSFLPLPYMKIDFHAWW